MHLIITLRMIQMKNNQTKINKSSSNTSIVANKSSSKITVKPLAMNKPSPSPSNSKALSRYVSPTPTSKQKSNKSNSSSLKLFIGISNKSQSKRKDIGLSTSQKENTHPNIDQSKIPQEKKGRTLKEVRMAVSKLNDQQSKNTSKITHLKQQTKPIILQQRQQTFSQEQSVIKYIPKEIVEDYKKVSIDDFRIIKQTQEFQVSNEYLAIHKRLNCIFTIKQINKNMIIQHQLADQLAQSIKIQFQMSNKSCFGASVQKLYMVFHDSTSVYLILEPTLSSSLKKQHNSSINNYESMIKKFNKMLQDLNQLHRNHIILRNISLSSIKNEMGVLKITNIIRAATFSTKRRRQSFFGCTIEAPHQVISGSFYDSSYDMWSLGLVFYELIMKNPPFEGDYTMTLIKNLDFQLPLHLSKDIACLLFSLLCQKSKRITAEECLKTSFFLKYSNQNQMVNRDIYNFWSIQ